jgi:hypothetical protein
MHANINLKGTALLQSSDKCVITAIFEVTMFPAVFLNQQPEHLKIRHHLPTLQASKKINSYEYSKTG